MIDLEWVQTLPDQWSLSYLKFETKFINGAPFKPTDWSSHGTPIIRIENLNGGSEFNFFDGALDKRYEVQFGDLLFAWSGNIGTSFGPYIWGVAGRHYLNQHIFKLEGYQLHKRWLYWVLKAVTSLIESRTTGIIGLVHVTKSELGRIPVPSIPREEQIRISDFLDSKSKEVDRFVENKRRLIELFEEQKRATVARAVTRGITADVPLKPSGLDWLGEIPVHWDVRRNGRFFRERNENGIDGLPILSVSLHTGVTQGEDGEADSRPKRLIENRQAYQIARQGDIAYNMMRMWQGAIGVVPVNGLVSPAYVVAIPLNGASAQYYALLFKTEIYMNEVNRHSTGIVSDRNRLYWDGFKQMYSPFPPIEEQEQIVSTVTRIVERIDSAIAMAKQEIELIEEFRTTLISDVVVGKREVPTAAKEPEVLD